jgi:N-acetylglucosamine-6-phosphate deacetylase
MATAYPAALLDEPGIGKLTPGTEATLVVFDGDYQVKKFIESGETILL